MNKCLQVFREVAVDLEGEILVMGDFFITEDALAFVPYTPFSSSSLGTATLAGFILYGPAGIIAGQIVDGLKTAFRFSEAERIPNVEQAKQKSEEERGRDFGKTVQGRLDARGGSSFPRAEVVSLDTKEGKLLITTRTSEKLLFQGGSSSNDSKIVQAAIAWFQDQTQSPEGNTEGANVGICIVDLLDRISEHSSVSRMDENALEKIKGDAQWLNTCIDRIFTKLPKAHRNAAVEWLTKEGADLGAVMKASLEQSTAKTRERLILFTILLVLSLAASSLIGKAPGLVNVIVSFGLIFVLVGGIGALILGITLLEQKSRCKKLSSVI